MHAFSATILGGEFDGVAGTLKHGPEKGHAFVARVATVLASKAVSQVMLQNVAGHFCFLFSFRRPLFCVLQEIFADIHSYSTDPKQVMEVRGAVGDELALAALLAPLAGVNLRAPIRIGVSISDASEEGAGAALSTSFVKQLSACYAAFDDLAIDSAILNSADGPVAQGSACGSCGGCLADNAFSCHPKCMYKACSLTCWAVHESHWCPYRRNLRTVVWVTGLGPAVQVANALAKAKLFPKFSPLRGSLPDEFNDSAFLHSIDFLCTIAVSRSYGARKLVCRVADECWKAVVNGKSFLLVFRCNVFQHPALVKLLELSTVHCHEVRMRLHRRATSQAWVLSNLRTLDLASSLHCEVLDGELWPTRFVGSIVTAFADEAGDLFAKSLPSGEERQRLWIRKSLDSSTKGLARVGVAAVATDEIFNIIDTARDRPVSEHLRELYQLVDHRGSDVRLDSGGVLDSAAQNVPYPAPIWEWTTVPGYSCLVGVGVCCGRSVGRSRSVFLFA